MYMLISRMMLIFRVMFFKMKYFLKYPVVSILDWYYNVTPEEKFLRVFFGFESYDAILRYRWAQREVAFTLDKFERWYEAICKRVPMQYYRDGKCAGTPELNLNIASELQQLANDIYFDAHQRAPRGTSPMDQVLVDPAYLCEMKRIANEVREMEVYYKLGGSSEYTDNVLLDFIKKPGSSRFIDLS